MSEWSTDKSLYWDGPGVFDREEDDSKPMGLRHKGHPLTECTSECIENRPRVAEAAHITVRSIDGQPTQFIAEISGREVGRMSVTVMPLVHDMEIEPSLISRHVADALFYYASGKVKAAGFNEAAVFIADDNDAMQRYMTGHGAIEEKRSSVYMIGIA